jgi:hypothetical protein
MLAYSLLYLSSVLFCFSWYTGTASHRYNIVGFDYIGNVLTVPASLLQLLPSIYWPREPANILQVSQAEAGLYYIAVECTSASQFIITASMSSSCDQQMDCKQPTKGMERM